LRDPSALAQLVEQLTVNQRVAGSSPAGGANSRKAAYSAAFLWVLACAALNSIWVKKNRMPLEAFRRPPSEID